jgi:hypothetical protein
MLPVRLDNPWCELCLLYCTCSILVCSGEVRNLLSAFGEQVGVLLAFGLVLLLYNCIRLLY